MKILRLFLVMIAILSGFAILGAMLPHGKWASASDITVWCVMMVGCAAGAYYVTKRIRSKQ